MHQSFSVYFLLGTALGVTLMSSVMVRAVEYPSKANVDAGVVYEMPETVITSTAATQIKIWVKPELIIE